MPFGITSKTKASPPSAAPRQGWSSWSDGSGKLSEYLILGSGQVTWNFSHREEVSKFGRSIRVREPSRSSETSCLSVIGHRWGTPKAHHSRQTNLMRSL